MVGLREYVALQVELNHESESQMMDQAWHEASVVLSSTAGRENDVGGQASVWLEAWSTRFSASRSRSRTGENLHPPQYARTTILTLYPLMSTLPSDPTD